MEEHIPFQHVLAVHWQEVGMQVFLVSLLVYGRLQILEAQAFEGQDSLGIHCQLVYLAVELEVVEVADSPHFLSDLNQDEILIWNQSLVLLDVILQEVERQVA